MTVSREQLKKGSRSGMLLERRPQETPFTRLTLCCKQPGELSDLIALLV